MLISVVIPVYNSEKYLVECIESVIGQTYENIEIILIDDGSTDSSGIICDEYAEKDSRIKVIHKKNEGQFAARITGIKNTKGTYVTFLDSDDELREDAVQFIADKTGETDCDILLFEGSRGPRFSSKYINIPLEGGKLYKKESLKEVYRLAISTGKLNCMCMKAFKRELFDLSKDYSAFFSMRNGEDSLMLLIVLRNVRSVCYTDEILYYYRINQESVTFRYNSHMYEDYKIVEIKRRECSVNWFGKIEQAVYDRNIRVCFQCILYEAASGTGSVKTKYRKIERILKDEFFISSYKMSDKKGFSLIERTVLFTARYFNTTVILLILLYNCKKMLKKKCSKRYE